MNGDSWHSDDEPTCDARRGLTSDHAPFVIERHSRTWRRRVRRLIGPTPENRTQTKLRVQKSHTTRPRPMCVAVLVDWQYMQVRDRFMGVPP